MERDRNFINGVAIISCSDIKHEEMAIKISGVESLPEPQNITDNVISFPWHIETKYYSTDVYLTCLKSKDLVSANFADSIEAVLIHLDNTKASSFKQVESWLPFVKKFNPEVRFLACNNCNDVHEPAVSKCTLTDWCLKNQFELIELYPDEDSDEEDDFKETKGYKRIIEALHAHSWSNLTMKDPPVYVPSDEILNSLKEDEKNTEFSVNSAEKSSNGECASGICTDNKGTTAKKTRSEKIDSLLDEDRWLFDAVGKEDPGSESFESLFERILSMKEKASSLNGDDRKLYAEKVAMEFWRAIGGDEEEIAGLDDNEN